MASPHVCGLLAYLLSIHGTSTFTVLDDPVTTEAAGIYDRAYSLLPRLVQAILPAPAGSRTPSDVSPEVDDTARPIPPNNNGTLTPAQLKKALIALASPGMLTELPSGSPNLIIFNNATVPMSRK